MTDTWRVKSYLIIIILIIIIDATVTSCDRRTTTTTCETAVKIGSRLRELFKDYNITPPEPTRRTD